ncbi:MAG: type II secretion system protein [Candidatus Carbobacillus sp.]|nr:type II secretion system protein [Candidatus Carbobacillus sp.]
MTWRYCINAKSYVMSGKGGLGAGQEQKKDAGYTLIELLIVLALIGLTVPTMLLLYQYAAIALASREADIRQIENSQFVNRYVRNWWVQYADGYDDSKPSNQQILTQEAKIYWRKNRGKMTRLEVTVPNPKDSSKPYYFAFRKDRASRPQMWRLIWDTSKDFYSARSGALAEWPVFDHVNPDVTDLYIAQPGHLSPENLEKSATSPVPMSWAVVHWLSYRLDRDGKPKPVYAQTSFGPWPLSPEWIKAPSP